MDQQRKNICNQVQTEKIRTEQNRPDYIISRKNRTEQNRTEEK